MIPKKPSIIELFRSFPSLREAARSNNYDETILQSAASIIQWAHNSKLNDTAMQAAYFVALALNDFEKLPIGAKFDFGKAIKCWDEPHCAVFRTWVANCLVVNPKIQPVSDLDGRKIEFDL